MPPPQAARRRTPEGLVLIRPQRLPLGWHRSRPVNAHSCRVNEFSGGLLLLGPAPGRELEAGKEIPKWGSVIQR